MTREEAIKILKECRERKFKYTFYTLDEYQTATDMAIQALEQEPDLIHNEREQAYMKGYEDASKRFRTEPCEDAISRQAALDCLTAKRLKQFDFILQAREEIMMLPSVSTEKTGRWSRKTKVDAYDIAGVKTWGIKCQCDRCTFTTIVVEDFGYYKFCPNCGAKMEEKV